MVTNNSFKIYQENLSQAYRSGKHATKAVHNWHVNLAPLLTSSPMCPKAPIQPRTVTPLRYKFNKKKATNFSTLPQLNIPYKSVFTRNAYVGRSFIQPSTALRQSAVARKFGVLGVNFVGARIVLVDDSIVRGNTMQPIVKLLRDNGAKEVHIRIASPPVRHPCYMGINIPSREELIAAKKDVEDIRQHMGADSLAYLSVDGLKAAVDRALLATRASQRSVEML